MKKTLQKFLSILLVLCMAVPLFAVQAAAKSVSATISSEEFANPSAISSTYPSADSWSTKAETPSQAPTVTIQDGVMQVGIEGSAYNQLIAAPTSLAATSYTFSGKIYFSGRPASSYYQVSLGLNAFNTADGFFRIFINNKDRESGELRIDNVVNGAIGDTKVVVDETAVLGKWMTFIVTRNGQVATLTLHTTDANGAEVVYENSLTLSSTVAETVPVIRVQSGGDTSGQYVKFDNFHLETALNFDATAETFSLVSEDFTGVTMTAETNGVFNSTTTDWTSMVETNSGNVTAAIAPDGTFTYKTTNNAMYWVQAPTDFFTNQFTFSGKIRLDNPNDYPISENYCCIFFNPNRDNRNSSFRIYFGKDFMQLDALTQDAKNVESTEKITDYANYLDRDLRFQLTRNGTALTFTLWVEGQYDATRKTVSTTMNTTAASTPSIRLQSSGTTFSVPTTVVLDDLRVESTVGDLRMVGVQVSTETANNAADTTFDMRFIAAVDSDVYSKAGFNVTAKASGSGEEKSWRLETGTVYSAIVAKDGNTTATYTAKQLGGKYLIALTVQNIPKSEGTVDFTVQAFTYAANGHGVFYSNGATCTANVKSDGTVYVTNASGYSTDTEVFNTFADLKNNVSLYVLQAPCVRSIKGYYAANDGGAGSYNIVTEKPALGGQQLSDGLWAVPNTQSGEVNVKLFGAKGDAATDDTAIIAEAVSFASQNNVTLVLPQATYKTMSPTVLENVTVRSENAKISFHGMDVSKPAVDVRNNVTVTGTLNIWFIAGTGHGGRCGLGIGNYNTGAGYSNIKIENVVITGGHSNCNGLFITGDSHNIDIGTVTIPDDGQNLIGRGVLLHWGNANDHYVPENPSDDPNVNTSETAGGKYYAHKPGWATSKHPHDVRFGTVNCTNLSESGEGAFHIAAAYNVTVENLIVNEAQKALCITGGDIGYEYADESVKAHKQCGLKFGNVTATNIRKTGVEVISYAIYMKTISVDTEIEITSASITGNGSATNGMSLQQLEKATLGNITLKNFGNAGLYLDRSIKTVTVNTLTVDNCGKMAINSVATYGVNQSLTVGTLNVKNMGSSTTAMIHIAAIGTIQIETLNTTNVTSRFLLRFTGNATGATISTKTDLSGVSSLEALVNIDSGYRVTNGVKLTKVTGVSSSVTDKSGYGTCTVTKS